MKKNRHVLRIHLALFTVSLLYAGNYSIAQWAMPQYIGPFGFILLRVFFGAVIFGAFYRWLAFEPIREKRHYLELAIAGFFGVALNMLAFFKGLSLTEPINASVIMLFSPVFVVIFSAVRFKRKLGVLNVVGLVISFVAAIYLIGGVEMRIGEGWKGDILVMLNACSYGYYLVYVSKLLQQYKATTITAFIFLFGLIMVLPFGLPEVLVVDWSSLSSKAVSSIAYVLIGVTVMAYFLNAWGVQRSSSTLVGSYIYLQPVLATVIAVGLGQDILSPEKAIFAAIIILGVYLVNRKLK